MVFLAIGLLGDDDAMDLIPNGRLVVGMDEFHEARESAVEIFLRITEDSLIFARVHHVVSGNIPIVENLSAGADGSVVAILPGGDPAQGLLLLRNVQERANDLSDASAACQPWLNIHQQPDVVLISRAKNTQRGIVHWFARGNSARNRAILSFARRSVFVDDLPLRIECRLAYQFTDPE